MMTKHLTIFCVAFALIVVCEVQGREEDAPKSQSHRG